MFRIIDRYLLRELLVAALWAVAVLTFVLVLGNVFKQVFALLVSNNLPFSYILAFIAYLLPFSLTFTVPWGFLTAILLVFGKWSASNELTALRVNGVPITRITAPVVILSALLSVICLWINLQVAPRAQENIRNQFYLLATTDPIALFNSDQIITEFPNRKIYVGRKIGDRLENIHVYELNKNAEVLRVVYAATGSLEVDLERRQLLMKLTGTRFEQRDETDPTDITKIRDGITMQEFVFPISLEELYNKRMARRGLNIQTAPELFENLKSGAPENRSATLTEVNRRFSFSLACLTFCLVGIPLGVTAQRKETSAGFGISLVVAFLYFFLIIVANLFRDKPKFHPELLMWLPNVIFIALGIWLFLRMARR